MYKRQVQILADIPSDYGAVVDIGSGIQAERTRTEASKILSTRNNELTDLTERMKAEFDQLEESTMVLATEFNEKMTAIESVDEPKAPVTSSTDDEHKRKPRRRRGTELTLDD